MATALSHVGVCVSDIAASTRFYCEALGFERAESFEVGDEFAGLMELAPVRLASQFLRRGDQAVELLHFAAPGVDGDRSRRPLNHLGLTHLCFHVDDVDSVAEAIEAAGGAVLTGTRTTLAGGALDFVYCTDPDGTRIELMKGAR
ncbi:MAG: VOC family protein [Acidimicrobiales bacterium]|nr:VOC family protein [Acidimicrobiales bacterium]MCB1017829.1 VOC family protein [Acidimicrobiales bacterium]MCB9371222.1 VOC family protein [Microthrixaceae bacterium]